MVFASVWSHIISLSNEQKHPHLHKTVVLPYLIAGLIGVPLGSYLLDIIQPATFKIVLGIFLVLWCPVMFFNPAFPRLERSGKLADGLVGFLGGILGGLGGFCGSLPSA